MSLVSRRVIAATVVAALLAPAGLASTVRAQSPQPAPRVVRGRLGAEGGQLAAGNVRLLVPAGALRGDQFVALGVGGVPAPVNAPVPTGDTGVLVSSSGPLDQPLTLLIAPSAADLAAASGDPGRLALMNTATLSVGACRLQPGAIVCSVPGPGLFLIAASPVSGPPPADARVPLGKQQRRWPLAVLAGVGAAALSGVVLFYLLRPLRNSAESNSP